MMKQKDHKQITEKELAEAVKEVLLKPVSSRSKQDNRKPTKEQVNQRFKLIRRNK